MRTRWVIVAAATVAITAVAACTGSDVDGASSGDDGGSDVSEAAGMASTTGAPGDGDGGGGAGGDEGAASASLASFTGEPIQAGRSIIATATMDIVADDVAKAASRARDEAAAFGGFVAHQDADLSSGHITISLRVPSTKFDEALSDLAALGEVANQTIDTDDVTEEIVDLESRIGSSRASIERLRELLGRTGDVSQLAGVEGELARREADLESLLGRVRVLEDQVDLSTISLNITGTPDEAVVLEPKQDDSHAGFLGGLGVGWDALAAATVAVLTVVGFVTPFAPVLLVAGVAWVLWLRRRSGAQLGEPDHAGVGA